MEMYVESIYIQWTIPALAHFTWQSFPLIDLCIIVNYCLYFTENASWILPYKYIMFKQNIKNPIKMTKQLYEKENKKMSTI